MKKERGYSIVEIVTFITIIGVVVSGTLLAIQQVLTHASLPNKQLQAQSLAKSRLAIIRFERDKTGFSSLVDPCVASPSIPACSELSTFATNAGLSTTSSLSASSSEKDFTISVSGLADYIMQFKVFNYEG